MIHDIRSGLRPEKLLDVIDFSVPQNININCGVIYVGDLVSLGFGITADSITGGDVNFARCLESDNQDMSNSNEVAISKFVDDAGNTGQVAIDKFNLVSGDNTSTNMISVYDTKNWLTFDIVTPDASTIFSGFFWVLKKPMIVPAVLPSETGMDI